MQFSDYVKRSLRECGVRPRKRLGQSFTIDQHIMRLMVEHAKLGRRDIVLEVGAGFGHLTEMLAEKAGEVLAVEVDPRLVEALRRRFQGFKNVRVVHGDFLKLDLHGQYTKVASDPPYHVASKILFKLLEEKFDLGVLLFQEEFARRLVAEVGSREYSRLTVMTYLLTEVEPIECVPSSSFYPKPKTASMMVKLKPRKHPPFKVADQRAFEETVRFMFSQKRRKVNTAVKLMIKRGIIRDVVDLSKDIPYLERRIFTLKPEEFEKLSEALCSRGL